LVSSKGGLAVNLEYKLLHITDKPIHGFCATGSVAGRVILMDHGTYLARAFAARRIAAKNFSLQEAP
jgi:hypothetical protein